MSTSFFGYFISREGVSSGWQEGESCSWLALAHQTKRTTTLPGVCQLLPSIHQELYLRSITSDFHDQKEFNLRIHLKWSPTAIQAFHNLKAPILHHPDPDIPFIVEVDASDTGIGAIFSQQHGSPPKLFPCALHSHKLNSAEWNYDVGNRELLAMKVALEVVPLAVRSHPFAHSENSLPEPFIIAPVQWDIMTELSEANAQEPVPPECPSDKMFNVPS